MGRHQEPLNERHALVVRLREESGLTFRAIGVELGISKERVRAIYAVATRKLRRLKQERDAVLPLPPGRLASALQLLNINTPAEAKRAIQFGVLVWRGKHLCHRGDRVRGVGWKNWVKLHELAGLFPPRKYRLMVCPHCGEEIEY